MMKTGIKFMVTVILSCIICSWVYGAPWVYMTLNYDFANHTYSAEAVYMIINGRVLDKISMPPIIMNGNTLVPMREVFEPLGAIVQWEKETEQIYIAYGDNIACFKVNSEEVNVNGEIVKMSTPAKIINNKTMIPVRVISEALGLNVKWDPEQRTVSIDAPVVGSERTTAEDFNDKQTEETTAFNYALTEAQTKNNTETAEAVDEKQPEGKLSEEITVDKSKYAKCSFSDNFDYDKANHALAIAGKNYDTGSFLTNKGKNSVSITMKEDIKDIADYGIYNVDDDYTDSIIAEKCSEGTRLIFLTKKAGEMNIYEENGFLYIKIQ